MNEFVSVAGIKDALAECPICTHHFDESKRIPRRMPCCFHSICQPCLTSIFKHGHLLCPMCRHNHSLPKGVECLPKEPLILRILDHLKAKKSSKLPCTDCSDGNVAMAKCDECSVYLCDTCLGAHNKNQLSRSHKTMTFEEMKTVRSTRPDSARAHEKSQDDSKLNKKLKSVKHRLDTLKAMKKNIDLSKNSASEQINNVFDDLVEELQKRRGILLSLMESKAEKETKSLTRAEESHKSLQEKLQKAARGQLSSESHQTLLDETPQDVDYDRRGITFLDLNLQEATNIIRDVGDIRTITFTPIERPDWVEETEPCNEVSLEYNNTSKAAVVFVKEMPKMGTVVENKCALLDQVIVLKEKTIICPHLEYDHSTSSEEISISGTVVRNTGSGPYKANTGCRLQSGRAVILSKPFVSRENQQEMYMVKVNIRMKKNLTQNIKGYNWFIVSSVRPEDVTGLNDGEFKLAVGTCQMHHEHMNYFCLSIVYNDERLFCVPVLAKTVGSSCDLHLALLLDYELKVIHVLDAAKAVLLTSANNVVFDEPLWTKLFLGGSINQTVQTEFLSGNKIHLATSMVKILNTL